MKQIDIKGFEGYQITDDGRVWSKITKKWLKDRKSGSGYYNVALRKNGATYEKEVHRLVAEAFINNPNWLPIVNHKDENKTNNNVENLEWCSAKYNFNYGTCKQRISISVKKNTIFKTNNPNPPKKVSQYDLDGNLVNEYPSMHEAATKCGISQPAISIHIKNQKPLFGYIWKYKNDQPN